MVRLIVSERAADLGVQNPVACVVRKYTDHDDMRSLASRVESLQQAVSSVREARDVPILIGHAGSITGDLWLECRDAAGGGSDDGAASRPGEFVVLEYIAAPSAPFAIAGGLWPLPPLQRDTTTALFTVVGANGATGDANRALALDVIHAFKRVCPTAYAQFIPTVRAARAGG